MKLLLLRWSSNLMSGNLYLRVADILKQGNVNIHHTVSLFV